MSATPARPASGDRQQSVYRSIRILAMAAIAILVIGSLTASPAPGGSGQALGITIALVAFCVAALALLWLPELGVVPRLIAVLVAVLSSATLIGLQPRGGGFLGLFPAVSIAALMLPVQLSAAAAGVALVALPIAAVIGARQAVFGTVLNELGVLAFYLLALLARRLGESHQRAESLLAELQETRAAQAEAVALAERQRLAREMHDVLAHSLSGLVLNLEGARLLAQRAPTDPQVSDAIERAQRLAKTGLEEARRAIGMLRDDALPGPEGLQDLVAEFESDSGVPCTVTITGNAGEASADGRLTLYRVAQEALTNVRKHATATRAEVRLAFEASGTRLTIEDFQDGARAVQTGDDPATVPGYGLTGMRERAELLGGSLTAGPTGQGFRVELWVPT